MLREANCPWRLIAEYRRSNTMAFLATISQGTQIIVVTKCFIIDRKLASTIEAGALSHIAAVGWGITA